MKRLLRGALLLAIVSANSYARAEPNAPALVEKFECARCHDGLPGKSFPTEKHCVKCHQDILSGRFNAPDAALRKWQNNIHSLTVAPSLAGHLLDRDFVRAFLGKPHKIRPNLPASMPRLALSQTDIDTLATLLAASPQPAVDCPVDPEPGRKLYRQLNCGSCHRFTGTDVDAPIAFRQPAPLAIALAPDLRHTATRMSKSTITRWLLDPAAHKPGTLMPKLVTSVQDAGALAQFICDTPRYPLAPPPPPPLKRLPVLQRRVAWDEVNDKVFRRTCWHCHSQPDYALGDGGPGNTGGFGFPPRGLDLANATGASSGAFDETGKRQSIFRAYTDGTPRLLAVLLHRHAEERGTIDPNLRGMPLGLPALTAEQIQLVESWIAQGRPR